MNRKTEMKRQELIAHLLSLGYTEDKWGHYKKEKAGKIYRWKFQQLSVRHEVKTSYGWRPLGNGQVYYIKNFHLVVEDGKTKISFKPEAKQ